MSPDGFVSHVPCRPIELSAHANEKRSSQEDLFGWKKGLEPSTFGTTIRRSNQLSYIHRVTFCGLSECKCNTLFRYVQKFRAKNRGEIAADDKMSDCPARLSCKICQKGVGTSLVEVKGAKAKQNITINLKNAEL